MMTNLIHYFGVIGKIVVFLLILAVIVTAIIKHGKPKVVQHSVYHAIIFNLGIILLYSMTGMLNTVTIGLVCVALFHLGDIVMAIRKNGFVEFTTFNAYKSVPIMIFYFMSLYLTNYWNPVLMF